MRIEKINLSFFNAGDVVNTTNGPRESGFISSMEKHYIAPEMKTFYDKTLITLAGANLVHEQFGQKRPIPKNGGKTIEFRKFSKLPKALRPITEGVTPSGKKLCVSSVSCTVDQYGDYIEQTDMLELTAIDNTIVEATKELASQAGLTLDTVVRNELIGGTNVMYVPCSDGKNDIAVTSRSDITSGCRLRVKDVFKAAAELKAVNAPKINGSYVAIIHPYVAYDLMQDAGEQWIGIQKYADPENILKGEIGMLGGVRFVESTEAKIISPDEIIEGFNRLTLVSDVNTSTTLIPINEDLMERDFANPLPVFVGGEENTITGVQISENNICVKLGKPVSSLKAGDVISGRGAGRNGDAVFCTLFLGENAYGVTDIEGGGLEHIVKQRGYGNDPLNQRSSVGWKATKVAKRLLEEYILRVESASEFSATAEAN